LLLGLGQEAQEQGNSSWEAALPPSKGQGRAGRVAASTWQAASKRAPSQAEPLHKQAY